MSDGNGLRFAPGRAPTNVVKDNQGHLEPGTNTLSCTPIRSVTQLTSNATAVTLDAWVGKITLFGAVGASGDATFVLNNQYINLNSHVLVSAVGASATANLPIKVSVSALAAGSCSVHVQNTDGVNASDGAPVVHIVVRNN